MKNLVLVAWPHCCHQELVQGQEETTKNVWSWGHVEGTVPGDVRGSSNPWEMAPHPCAGQLNLWVW